MTNAKEREKPQVKIREPKKKTQGIFDNLRPLPHPVEEILGLLPADPASPSTPVSESVSSAPVDKPLVYDSLPSSDISKPPSSTPVATRVATGAATLVNTPVTTPVEEDVKLPSPQYLDATHSGSEARVYSVMYRETISKGERERHFGPAELSKKTGIRSDKTIRVALRGLVTKLSVQILSNVNGSPLGPRYRVFDPKEIIRRRKTVGMEIDPQSKKIITLVETPVSTRVDTGGKNYPGSTVETTPVTPVISTGVIKYKNNHLPLGSDTALSSSKSTAADDGDDAFLESMREIYERATGNTWTTADVITTQSARDVRAEVWGIAICYCVDRAPGHKFERLAYVLDQAREHAEMMKDYSESDLKMILRHSLRTIKRARESGTWELPGGKGSD